MKLPSTTLTLICIVLILTSYHLQVATGTAFCDAKCKVRCSKAGMMDRCLHHCGVCCEECKCVPSGTYGNKDECPCYRDKVTKDGKNKPKCP